MDVRGSERLSDTGKMDSSARALCTLANLGISACTLGFIRAWLSLQTGISDLYATSFPLAHGFDWLQHLTLVVVSALLAIPGCDRLFGREERLAYLSAGLGAIGAVAYGVGAVFSDVSPAVCAVSAVLLIAVFLCMLRVWCETNVTNDLPKLLGVLCMSFVAQYIAYAFVLVLPPQAQLVCAVGMPLVIALLLARLPAHLWEVGRDESRASLADRPQAKIMALAGIVGACCVAHGSLFGFSETVTGVWLIGLLLVVGAIAFVLVRGRSALFRNFVLASLLCQAAGVVVMMLFSYDHQWTSCAKSLSYAASMILATVLGTYLAAGRVRHRGSVAFSWLALYFAAFYVASYAIRLLTPDSPAVLAVILICLIVAAALMFVIDWSDVVTGDRTLWTGDSAGAGGDGVGPAEMARIESLGLTRREEEVLRQIITGMTFKEIARSHDVSVNTVRAQSQSLYRKLGIHSKGELRRFFSRTSS